MRNGWLVNLLWPSDAIWRQRSGSQVMACCLMTASHNLSHCWMEFLDNPCKDAISMNICKLLLRKIAWESFIFNRKCQDYVLIKFPRGQWVNSLWPSDAIWWQRYESTLAQVMACCLMAPSHNMNQHWLIISEVKWHSHQGNFTRDTSTTNH